MSERFIKFNDEQLDAKQVMMLQDLDRLLLKHEQTQVKIQKFPYYNPFSNTLITSWFWSHRPRHVEQAGLKTDVYLQLLVTLIWMPQLLIKFYITKTLNIQSSSNNFLNY